MEIKGKVFIVTGGASGLGEGTARMLAAEGATVVVVDIDVDGAQSAAAEPTGRRLGKTSARWASMHACSTISMKAPSRSGSSTTPANVPIADVGMSGFRPLRSEVPRR